MQKDFSGTTRTREKKKEEKKERKKKEEEEYYYYFYYYYYTTRNKTHKSKRPRVRSPFASLKGALALTLHALIILSIVNVQR
jgi:hypothetical protein